MLRGIPAIISPDLLKVLDEMGHGDDIVIGDLNFPAASNARILIRADGHNVPDMLDAILKLFPLDTFTEKPVVLMRPVSAVTKKTEVQDRIQEVVRNHDERGDAAVESVDRFEFYERAKRAYAIVATTDSGAYGCVIIKKGVLR